jgi:hypothetical protein
MNRDPKCLASDQNILLYDYKNARRQMQARVI